MKKQQLTIKEKQDVLIKALKEGVAENNSMQYAIFGIEKDVAMPLVKSGILHKDTWRYTGGAVLTKLGRQ